MKILAFAAALALVSSPAWAVDPPTIHTQNGYVQAIPVTPYDGAGAIIGAGGGGGATPSTHAQTTALAASLVAKASAGTLANFTVSADATLSAAAWYVLIFDATSLPADGAVTPAKCYPIAAGVQTYGASALNIAFTSGITIGVSTTGCFTKTASVHASFIGVDFQ